MKSVVFCALVLATVCICQIEADCEHEGKTVKTGEEVPITCGLMKCHEDGSMSGKGCGQYQCAPGKQIGYNEGDKTKVYPDCCGGPICKE